MTLKPIIFLSLFILASTSSTSAQTNFDRESLRPKIEADVSQWDIEYAAGKLTDSTNLQHYIAALSFLNRYEDAFNVLTSSVDENRLPKTAERMSEAAYYLVRQDKLEQATPFYREAIALGDSEAQIKLTENLVILSNEGGNRDCSVIKEESLKSVKSGWSIDLANQFIGNCYFGSAEDKMAETCKTKRKPKLTDTAKAEIEKSKTYLRKIPAGSPEYARANKWLELYGDKKTLRTFICGKYQ